MAEETPRKKKAPRKRKRPPTTTATGAASAPKKKAPHKKPSAKKPKKKKTTVKKTGPKANAKKTPKPARKKATPASAPAANVLGKKGTSKSTMTALLTLDQISVLKGFNPRTSGPGDLATLKASIKNEGLLSSLVVRPTKAVNKFSIVAGERRYLAMQAIGYKRDIPVVIRADLVGDNARAKAVALAENSEDGRSNLNPIEIGRVVELLSKEENWSGPRIASETCQHIRKVQRCLKLMTIDPAVRKKVEKGEIGMVAGLEFAQLDDKTRKLVASEITSGTTAADVRRFKKEAANKAATEAAADAATKDGKKIKKPKVTPTAWRGSREKQALLREVSYDLVQMQEENINPSDYEFIENRAVAVVLLWDRGDLSNIEVPAEDTDDVKEKKALIALWKKINGAAALYVPPEEELEVDEADEPEETTVS